MAKRKVKLQFIADASKRKRTLKRRQPGLIKKVSEVNTLCGVDSCVMIFGENDDKPTIWPSPSEAHRILTRFSSVPELEKRKYMLDQKSYLSENLSKMEKTLQKNHAEKLLEECIKDGEAIAKIESKETVDQMMACVEGKLKKIAKRIKFLDGRSSNMQVDDAQIMEVSADEVDEEEEVDEDEEEEEVDEDEEEDEEEEEEEEYEDDEE